MVRTLLIFWLAASAAHGANIAVKVAGTTATQAILSYTAPDNNACAIAVSPSSSLSPLVNDVNSSLFSGANSDNRAGSLISGESRVVVIGARTSALGSDGNYYSRALQALTQYFFSVTCGASTGSGTFTTRNAMLGNSAPEAVPFLSGAWGNQGWPSMSWSDQSKQYIDPLTGLLIKRVSGPGQSGGQLAFGAPVSATDLANAWTTPANVIGGNGYASTSAKGQGNALFLPLGSYTNPGFTNLYANDDIQFRVTGYTDTSGDTISACISINYGQSCMGNSINIALPVGSGSATQVYAPSNTAFPAPLYAGWGSPKLTAEEIDNLTGIASVNGSTVTRVSNDGNTTYFPLSLTAGDHILLSGSSPICPNNDCTIASLADDSHLTLTRNLGSWTGFSTSLSGNIAAGATTFTVASTTGFVNILRSYYLNLNFNDGSPETVFCATLSGNTFSGCSATANPHLSGATVSQRAFTLNNYGFKVWNSGSSGTVFLQNAALTMAQSPEFTIGDDGTYNPCSVSTVTVSYAADGVTPLVPSQQGRVCLFIDAFDNPNLYLFVPQSGEVRQIAYGDNIKGNGTATSDPNDPNTVYYAQNNSANPNIYKCTYNSSVGHYAALPPDYTGAATPNFACTNMTAGTGNDLFSQIGRIVPGFDSTYFSRISGFGGLLNHFISITVQLGQNSIGYGCFFDVTQPVGSQITGCHDTWSTYPERWGGLHGGYVTRTSSEWASVFLVPLNIQGATGIGLYQFSVNSITGESGTTALTSTISSDPTRQSCSSLGVTDPQWIALGATGNNCIQMVVATEPQNVGPSASDLTKWPSACHTGWAQLQTIQPGDYLYDSANGLFGEQFLVVGKTGSGCSPITLVLARGMDQGTNGGCAAAPQTHSNGWIPVVGATQNCDGVEYWSQMSSPAMVYVDNAATTLGHTFIGQSDGTGTNLTQYAVYDGNTSNFTGYGVRQGSLPGLIGQPFSYGVNMIYPFSGAGTPFSGPGIDINHIQAHPGGQSYLAPTPTLGYDGRPIGGPGGALPVGWYHQLTAVSGQSNTYQISCAQLTAPGGTCNDSLDRKRLGMVAFAGRFMLTDISGPSSRITDLTPYSYCIADFAGECVSGSSAGNRYVSVPQINTSGSCLVGNLDQNTPCLATAPVQVGQATQYNWGASDPFGLNWRRLGYALGGPGQTNNFWNVHGITDASWAFTEVDWKEGVRKDIVAIQLPPWPTSDTVNRTGYVQVPIQLSGNAGDQIRIEFGYQEYGAPNTLNCASRNEACFTSSSAIQSNPFQWASETQAYTSCGSGCTVNVPARASGLLYYRVHRKNAAGVEATGPVQVAAVQ